MTLNDLLKMDIVDILTYDFKGYLLDDEVMKKVGECQKFLTDIGDRKDLLTFKKGEHLENWLRYRSISALLYRAKKGLLDCDTSELTQEFIGNLYGTEESNGREYLLHGVKMESDTLNSLNSILGAYIKREFDWDTPCLAKYPRGNQYKFFFYLENIDELKNKNEEIYKELNLLALLTHTIGNFGLVPLGFNCYRGHLEVARDYYDLSLDILCNLDLDNLNDIVEKIKKANRRKIDCDDCIKSLKKFREVMNDELYSYTYKCELKLKERPQARCYKFTDDVYLELLCKMNDMVIRRGIIVLRRLGVEITLDDDEIVRRVRESI